ncbi:MAG: caspase family protein, partial [Usitatibacteraceae bacterium]
VQYRGQNYLIPTDAKLTSEASIAFNAMPVTQILDTMDEAKIRHKFIILDACRNNPFSNVFTSTGLAKIQAPAGTIVSFAAAAGQVAPDGAEGVNSLYTRALVKEMRDPQLQAAAMFQRVQTVVAQESTFKQLPELHNTPLFRVPFFFAERGAQSVAAGAAPATGLSGDAQAAIEGEFWRSAKEGKRVEGYQAYLEKYPNGNFASLARLEIDRMKRERSQQEVVAAPLSASVSSAPVLQVDVVASSATAATSAPQTPTTTTGQAPTKIVVANAPATNPGNDSRGMEIRQPAPQTAAQAAPVVAPRAAAVVPAPVIDKVASIAPEQLTSVPPVPTAAKLLSGRIAFPEGAVYTGEYKENKDKLQILHGQGEFISPAFQYKGEFRENKKQGKGAYMWANGNRYEGDFVDDEPSGRGVFAFASGDKYEGEYTKGAFNGKGVFVAKNGDKTDGVFVNGQANGRAVYLFANGDKYEGDMAGGKMSGQGVFTSKGGDRWEATFANDRAQGKGIYYFSNGDRYEGEFANGAMTGKGVYFYSTGYRSEGSYVNAQLNGEGKFYFNDGSWFEGVFEQGLKRAKGFAVSKEGTKRSATMVDGQVKLDGG